jgi:RNA polymerase sigma-70 factor (ECF subfamily)
LLARCISGDAEAWDALIEHNERAIYNQAFHMCRNHEDASDIVSHVFVKIYKRLHTYSAESNFSVWVHSIIRNTFLDICIRSRWHARVTLEPPAGWEADEQWLDEFADPAPTPEAVCLQNETSKLLLRELKYLPSGHRLVLRMFVEDGKSYRQISADMGIPIGTVRSRINRARHNLQDRLMPYRDILFSA